MNIKLYALLLCLALFASCGNRQEEVIPSVPTPLTRFTPPKKIQPEKFVYQGDRYRDPFLSLQEGVAVSASSNEIVPPDMGGLFLKGIFYDKNVKMALLQSSEARYFLRGSRLYDGKQRMVRGFSGLIKKDSVVIIGPDGTTKELRLRQKR
jgi:hypothetical protein